ncbi:uncharacterized protein AB675_11323 [Cyphellophora attinorum]|uniref:Uncharacterized protein n=1 Tax=Cyphellophora attinorum TaxID=1664694 RepID=A0A0N0NM47_9EURO|nr:uncharacterized protein AB675_11323 [Phialophora attinorum]KPI40041.1 hypothetical protein AB675_11323 [Phialophora attinorum]
MPEKRKSARISAIEAAPDKKKVKYNDDYDSDDDDYDELVPYSEPEPEIDPEELARQAEEAQRQAREAERLAAIAAKKAQVARNKIRALLTNLPDDEAGPMATLLDEAEAWEKPGARYSWSKLPQEIKDRIYEFTFISEDIVVPYVTNPRVKDARKVRTFKLGANFMRCSKEIHEAGKAMLLGLNMFENDTGFKDGLILDKYPQNYLMIRKVVIDCRYVGQAIARNLNRLTQLSMLVLIKSPFGYFIPDVARKAHEMARSFGRIDDRVFRAIRYRDIPKVYFIYQTGSFKATHKTSGETHEHRKAVRFRVEKWNPDEKVDPGATWVVEGMKLTVDAKKTWPGLFDKYVLMP